MHLTRRAALRSGTAIAAAGLAGCLGGGSGETVDSLPAPTKGPSDASVTVQAFENFTCPHCRTFAVQVLPRIESEYIENGNVRYEHRDLPFNLQGWDAKAASAARAVQDEQGDEAFFNYAHALYENMDNYSLDLIGTLAEDVGADPEAVKTAADDLVYKAVLEDDIALAEELGVTATPTVFVDGEAAPDPRFETIAGVIESKL